MPFAEQGPKRSGNEGNSPVRLEGCAKAIYLVEFWQSSVILTA